MFDEDSAAGNIAKLKKGEVFTRSTLIPMSRANANLIAAERDRLVKILSPVVARVKAKYRKRKLSMHTTHAFTRSYDVIVSASVLHEGRIKEDAEEL